MRWAGLGLAAFALSACGPDKLVDTDQVETAYHSGYEAIQAGNWQRAEHFLIIAEARDPTDPYVQLNLGVIDQHLGELEKARAHYQRAIKTGEDEVPHAVSDPEQAGKSVADLARDNLATLEK
jgi:Flp pilus assembly protein TadD